MSAATTVVKCMHIWYGCWGWLQFLSSFHIYKPFQLYAIQFFHVLTAAGSRLKNTRSIGSSPLLIDTCEFMQGNASCMYAFYKNPCLGRILNILNVFIQMRLSQKAVLGLLLWSPVRVNCLVQCQMETFEQCQKHSKGGHTWWVLYSVFF